MADLSDFYFKMLGNMIKFEDSDGFYEISEKYAPRLLDMGYITHKRWSQGFGWGSICCSGYFVTDMGRQAYKRWKDER